jgi:hypothetical protein
MKHKLNQLDLKGKYEYLINKCYAKVETRPTGRLYVPNNISKNVANLLGGSYESLNKIQKKIFNSDITDEAINPEQPFDKYLTH